MKNTSQYTLRFISLLALLVCLCAPARLAAQDGTTMTSGNEPVSTNEDTKADLDMYVEYLPANTSSSSSLGMQARYKYNDGAMRRWDPLSESELMNVSEAVDSAADCGWGTNGGMYVIPVASSTPSGTWVRSPVYRMQGRPLNKIYQTPRFVREWGNDFKNISRYRLHYIVPDGFELYSRRAGTNDTFRPGAVLTGTMFHVPSQEDRNINYGFGEDPNYVPEFETILVAKNVAGALPGKATSINSGNAEMRFSLGFLPNGKSAGYLDFLHIPEYNLFDSVTMGEHVFSPKFGPGPGAADLRAVSLGDEVTVITKDVPGIGFNSYGLSDSVWPVSTKTRKGIEKIIAPQCIVDVIAPQPQYPEEWPALVLEFRHPSDPGAPLSSPTRYRQPRRLILRRWGCHRTP
jgi:hypothetical protein